MAFPFQICFEGGYVLNVGGLSSKTAYVGEDLMTDPLSMSSEALKCLWLEVGNIHSFHSL